MIQPGTSLAAPELQATGDSPESVTDDRRRPGRPDHVNPTLVPLLRGDLLVDLPLSDETELLESREVLAHVVGIAAAVCASALLWAIISFVGRAMSP
jgi:hypothetical protein